MERPTVMMRTRLTMLAMLTMAAVVAVVAGCAGQDDGGPGQAAEGTTTSAPGTTAGTTPTSTTTGATGGGTAPPTTTSPGQDPPGSIRVSGTVRAGVEPGCLLLDASQSQPYLLIDGDPAVLRPGSRVEVVGMLMDNVMSTCQQGVPLSVISATPV
jgi:hypothetical protein